MKPTCKVPRFVFPDGFTDRDEWEMERKGVVYAFLVCEDGCRYQVIGNNAKIIGDLAEFTRPTGSNKWWMNTSRNAWKL